MIKDAINRLTKGENLDDATMAAVMDEMMTGEATDAQKASFLTALAIKGETIDEISAAARAMKKHATPFRNDKDAIEIVGTGGDRSNTFNISTLSALVTAAAGYPVAKHGNRAASSKCGAFDCLEALGININADVSVSEACLRDLNLCLLFAQKYHPAMRFVGPVRKEIGIRTLFNILGPISNPAGVTRMLLGVYDKSMAEPLARVLTKIGVERAMVVYGMDCMDEISLSAPTFVCETRNGEYKTYEITPEQFGLTRCEKEGLVGGEPEDNAKIVWEILDGKQGPKFDAVVLNAGAAIYLSDGEITMEQGIAKAKEMLLNGAAKEKLEQMLERMK